MTLLVILLLIGLLFGLGGLLTAAKWLLIIMLVLWLAAALSYPRGRT